MDYNQFQEICQQSLLSNADALHYAADRRLSVEAISAFGIGYCPHTISDYIRDTDLEWLKGRLVFPIYDTYGKIVAFSGRALDNRKPKYINTAYMKSNYLYNLDKAKYSILSSGFVVLVEGFMDAISLYMAGVQNVVALCGVAFKPRRLALLARYTDNILVMLDSDAAGKGASEKVVDMCVNTGFTVKQISLYPYKDADEIIQSLDAPKFLHNVVNSFNTVTDSELDYISSRLEEL